jgi:hypothetical protein
MADTDIGHAKTWGAEVLEATDLNAEFSNVYTNHLSKSTAQSCTATKTFTVIQIFTGTYDKYLHIGAGRLWHDATNGCFRAKHDGAPSSETDGKIIMEGF